MVCKKIFISRLSSGVLLAGGLFILLLNGCASSSQYNKIAYCSNPEEQISNVKLQKYFDQIAEELCGGECGKRPCTGIAIMVPDFVDLQTMEPKKIGPLMGELMRTSMNRVCGYQIVQEQFSHLFKVTGSGLISLKAAGEDNSESVKASSSARSCILGTFSATSDKLYIFAKIVDNSDGRIIKMTSKEVKLSCD